MFWKRRGKFTPSFTFTILILTSSLTLVYSIWAMDTWLHVTTSTVLYSNLDNRTRNPDSAYATAFSPVCWLRLLPRHKWPARVLWCF
ncbi:hypothetical protein BKA65DRAFT_505722 [Rhexocercosporidium sp. MPI-PUGE-AT-0058]|nr:hypothetical protein BKA65DRAFT_505722 [Rhexocercosporidium sp. MPI-PUGE-AT-0058]